MNLARAIVLVAFLPSLPFSSVLAVQRSHETPEEVARHYLAAMAAGDWHGMTVLMHPVAMHETRQALSPLFDSQSPDSLREQLLGVRSVGDARSLSDTALCEAFLRQLSRQGRLGDILHNSKSQVIGHVDGGRDTTYVVYRMTYQDGDASISRLDVFAMRRMGQTWRGLLNINLSVLSRNLRRVTGT